MRFPKSNLKRSAARPFSGAEKPPRAAKSQVTQRKRHQVGAGGIHNLSPYTLLTCCCQMENSEFPRPSNPRS